MHGDLVVVDDVPGEFAERVIEAFHGRPNDAFSLAVSGGPTARDCYQRLAEDAGTQIDWWKVDVYWGDERCVPPDDERSNLRLARESLAERVDRPPTLHAPRTELEPERAAAGYDAELAGVQLELVLLGLGPDGHTASLFPKAPALDERERRAVVAEAGLAPWVQRVTMTIPVLEAAPLVLFLVTGEEKADAARRAFVDPPDPATPASLVRSRTGRTVALLDEPAAATLV